MCRRFDSAPHHKGRDDVPAFFVVEHFVYILYAPDKDLFYKGMTNDLRRRLKEHRNNEEFATAGRGPWILVWWTKKPNRSEACILERKLKNLKTHARIRDFMDRYPCEDFPE